MPRFFYQLLVSNGKHHLGAFLLPTGLDCPTPMETGLQIHFPGFDPVNLKIGGYVHHIMPDVHQQARGIAPGDFFNQLKEYDADEWKRVSPVVVADYRKFAKLLREAGWTLFK